MGQPHPSMSYGSYVACENVVSYVSIYVSCFFGILEDPGDLAVVYRRWVGGHGILEDHGDLGVVYRRWGGESWDSGRPWGLSLVSHVLCSFVVF